MSHLLSFGASETNFETHVHTPRGSINSRIERYPINGSQNTLDQSETSNIHMRDQRGSRGSFNPHTPSSFRPLAAHIHSKVLCKLMSTSSVAQTLCGVGVDLVINLDINLRRPNRQTHRFVRFLDLIQGVPPIIGCPVGKERVVNFRGPPTAGRAPHSTARVPSHRARATTAAAH